MWQQLADALKGWKQKANGNSEELNSRSEDWYCSRWIFFLFNLDFKKFKVDLNFLYFRNTVTQFHKGLDLFIEFS